ncbi:peptidylprolyl isomerase [Seonamhaeicola algicola]|uniref:peptidylprolyl isomerase n=1 Tax=Seonamhaeicola algicola TaxID=1719036 RepID=A0A5C7AMD6_9FLAO|nr:peptidylprolyl isomerase [Seonamhaeicola algicola]TXE09906.1 peptidylprolyl isomerase [Seonamhaeicola algicola]
MTFSPKFNVFLLALTLVFVSCKSSYENLDEGIYAEIKTTKGTMLTKLAYKKVPVLVANFVSLAEGTNTLVDSAFIGKKFYDGLIFHRVIDSFMIQGGDPLENGLGNPGYRFNDQFHPDLNHNKPGVIAMANAGPNTNGSQFYITEVPRPDLNDGYCVFGHLIEGYEVQDSISNVKTDANNKPLETISIKTINIIRKGKDAKKFDAPTIFKNHFIAEAKKEKKAKEKALALLKTTKQRFEKQKAKAKTLPSGLKYYITKKGSGPKLPPDSDVKTHYAVYFENGQLLQTSSLEIATKQNAVNPKRQKANGYKPIIASTSADAQMIPGFKEGLKQLNVGDKATLFLPYHLAYGEEGNRGIPPKSNLIFEVEVLSIE